MTTLRIYSKDIRKATAIVLPDKRILQVFPKKKMFDSESDWVKSYSDLEDTKIETKVSIPRLKAKGLSTAEKRRNNELMEFLDPSYNWMFKTLEIHGLPELKIKATLLDDSEWEIRRDLNFLASPPSLKKNGVEIVNYGDECWTPALTTIRWLMMVAFLEPEE